jgi:hypothetical protein
MKKKTSPKTSRRGKNLVDLEDTILHRRNTKPQSMEQNSKDHKLKKYYSKEQ